MMAQIMIIFLKSGKRSYLYHLQVGDQQMLSSKTVSALAQTLLHRHTSPLVFLFPVMSFSQVTLPFCLMLILFGSLGFATCQRQVCKGY